MAETPLMKDGLGQTAIDRIGGTLKKIVSDFDVKGFRKEALKGLEDLELKERVHHLIEVLADYLPKDFESTASILSQVPESWDSGDSDDPLSGFAAWPLIDYIPANGIDDPELALPLLRRLTPLFSAEFAIRPFIKEHVKVTFKHLEEWLDDADHHVRRLVSEGTRPRLPWGIRLKEFVRDPSPILPLLEKLKDDPSEYVRRSVANNLNDIAKDHPDVVIKTCRRWQKGADKNRKWVIRHATRTLVKAGHPKVFGLLGFTDSPQLKVQSFKTDRKRISVGEKMKFTVELQSTGTKKQRLVVDYAVHFMKANGQQKPKVFKLKTIELESGETLEITKQHPFLPITTRVYYSGDHSIELLVNGQPYGIVDFELVT